MSASTPSSSTIPGSPRAIVKPESPRKGSSQEPRRPSSPAPQHPPRLVSTWHRATPEAAPPSPPGSPRETGSPRRTASISLGSRDQGKTTATPADDLKRNPQIKRLAQESQDQPAPKRARTASSSSSPRKSSPRATPAQDAVQDEGRAEPSTAARMLAKAQLEQDCMQARRLGEGLQEIVTMSECMQFRVRDVADIVRTATEDLDNMICCFGDPDKHEKVEQYRGLVHTDVLRLHTMFEKAPSSISAHEHYAHTLSLTSEMHTLIVAVQADKPLAKASLVESPRRDERGRNSPRSEEGKADAVRKPLRVVMDPQKKGAAEKD